jgi:hypothetical protein
MRNQDRAAVRERRTRATTWLAVLLGTLAASCGGGDGSGSTGGTFILASFAQSGQDNVALTTILRFDFSEAVDPASVSTVSIQVREGLSFGTTVPGEFVVAGARVTWRPRLPTLCDFSDAALKPNTTYRVVVVGYPESFAIRATSGKSLDATRTFSFSTRDDDDPELLEDQIPGVGPVVLSATPGEVPGDPGANAAVSVRPAVGPAKVVIVLSENLNPCSVNTSTVIFQQHERGDPVVANGVTAPNGNTSGFVPATDSDPAPTSWGATNAVTREPVPRVVPATIRLIQSFDETRIEIEPIFGEFPDNALLVVELTFGILDFGGLALAPRTFSFTTENRPQQVACRTIEFLGETPIASGKSTADVNTSRAPGRAQGFLLFSGDGDNGSNLLQPSLPETSGSGCIAPHQQNDGVKDIFDPTGDVVLDTGTAVNTCPNDTDGSRAVVWEFQDFRIRNGVTVRVIGANPAIVLVQEGILIENGGRLLVRGDGSGGAPQGRGQGATSTFLGEARGGTGVAGGGHGGTSEAVSGSYPARYGQAGATGYYHGPGVNVASDVGVRPGSGGGHGNTSALWSAQTNPNNRNTPSGGGGGHATNGADGTALGSGTAPTALDLTPDGVGGGVYGHTSGRMLLPEAGSGGGAGGEIRPFSGNAGRGPGGAGGAGGGFLDLTTGGDIRIFGTVDAAGSGGGPGATEPFNPNYSWQPGSGGGGGGSGGGIRCLTPDEIELSSTTLITAAGGAGGVGGNSQAGGPPRNHGGAGGLGRVVLEDKDSLIVGLTAANVVPGEGTAGFFRGVFNATRFQGGGLSPQAVSLPFYVGPWNPTYQVPVAGDFVAGVPGVATRGPGATAILVEARASPVLADGSPGTPTTPWFTVGYFKDSGIEDAPTWTPSAQPTDVAIPTDNAGVGIGNLDGLPWFEFRFTFYLPAGISTTDPGPFVDRWNLCFVYDQ